MRPALVVVFLLAAAAPALGETPTCATSTPASIDVARWSVTQWTSRDGLPQNSVTSIAQTSDGYLWLATFGGLVRFDGDRFATTSVSHDVARVESRIASMHLDRTGDLWLGLMRRGVLRLRDGKITHYPPGAGVPADPIWRIVEDRQGVIWVAGRGLARLEDERFRAEPLAAGAIVWSMVADPSDGIHAITSRGVLRIDAEGARTIGIGDRPKPVEWWFIGHEPRAHPWLVGGATFVDVPSTPPPTTGREIDPEIVRASLVDRDGRWWLGAENGLFLGDAGADRGPPVFRQVMPEITRVRAVFEDTEGTLWIGTDGDGLFRLQRPAHVSIPYKEIVPRAGTRLRLAGDAEGVWCVRGAPRPRAVRLTSEGAEPTIDLAQHGVDRVVAALSGSDGSLWLSTTDTLVQLREDESMILTHDLPGPINALAEIDGAIVCGGDGYVAQVQDDRSFPILATPEGVVQRFSKGKRDDLWFITKSTLYRLAGDELSGYGQTAGVPASLRALTVASNGDVWIGSYSGGLVRLREGEVLRLTAQHGLPDNAISFVAVDNDRSLWAHSNRGVFRLRNGEVEAFAAGRATRVHCRLFDTGEAHGAQGWFSPDGKLVLPTLHGLVVFDVRGAPAPATVHVGIDAIRSGQRRLGPTSTLALEPSERSLGIEFSAVALGHADQLTVRYRVDTNESWREAGSSREVLLEELSPGHHRIEVAARAGDGPWALAEQRFSIAPFVHETAWFRGSVLFVIAAAIFTGVRLRLAHAERDRRRQSEQVTQAYERERRRIGRELHDDVSQRLAAIALENSLVAPGGANGSPRVTEALQGLAADVHRLSRQLHPSMLSDLGLKRAIESECREFSKRTGIATHATFCNPMPELNDETDLAMFRILQESLRNVEKHARAASVEIELTHPRDDWLVLRVADAGRGFDEDDRNGGLGLVSMRERAYLVGGRLHVSSRPERGTTVEVEVPCGPAH